MVRLIHISLELCELWVFRACGCVKTGCKKSFKFGTNAVDETRCLAKAWLLMGTVSASLKVGRNIQ